MVLKISPTRSCIGRLIVATGRVLALSLSIVTAANAQESPALPDPTADEQAAQQDQLVQGAAAKTIASPVGADSVGPDGSFSYSIPLRVPNGVRGVQPTLSLVYNSRVGNGLSGVGWTLKGIPEIHRISGGRGLNYDGDDQYAVNFNGWGAPDDPGLRLVYIGTDPRPRAIRVNDAVAQELLDLTRYVLGQVWGLSGYFLDTPLQAATNSPTQWAPIRMRGNPVPSVDVMSFVSNPTAAAPQPAILPSQVLTTWNMQEVFSWPCETTAVRCWLRILKIDPLDWPLLGIQAFTNNDIYHTANETWGEYRPHGYCGDGPCYWVLRDGHGNTYYFGGDENYHAQSADGSGSYPVIPERFNGDRGNRGILMWSLYEVVDRYGNGYKVSYHSIGQTAQTLVPARIDYLKTGGGTLSKAVTFTYESRPDTSPIPAYFDTRLRTVGVELDGQAHRQYVLTYETGTSLKSRLINVQETAPTDGSALPPYKISWQDPSPLSGDQFVPTQSTVNVLNTAAPVVADFNGDGFSDVAFVTQDYHGLSRQFLMGSSTGLGPALTYGGDVWDPNASPPDGFPGGWAFTAGDVDGDGKADLVRIQLGPDQIALSVGAGNQNGVNNFDTPRSVPWSGSADDNDWGNWQVICADINNDRIADVVVMHPGAPTVLYALGSHYGLLQPIVVSSQVAKLPHWAWVLAWSGGPEPANAVVASRAFAGDVNGDGYLDIFTSVSTLFGNASWNPTPQISYMMGSEAGLGLPNHWTPPPGQNQFITPVVADINGDNRADLVLGTQQVYYGRADVDAPLAIASNYDSSHPGTVAQPAGVGDANGDGIADLVGGALGNPSGAMTSITGQVSQSSWELPFFADLNGDGLQDVVQMPKGPSGVDIVAQLSQANGSMSAPVTLKHFDDLGGDDSNVYGVLHSYVPNPSKAPHVAIGDFNGDGAQDVLFFPYYKYNPYIDLAGPTKTKPPYPQALHVFLSRQRVADEIASITNTLGGVVRVSFTPAADVPGAIDNSYCPGCDRPNINSRLLVKRIVHDPGTNGPVRSISYAYKNGRIRSGGVFEDNDLGFAEIDVTDDQTHLAEKRFYSQTYPMQRRLVESDSLNALGGKIRVDKYNYDYITPYLGVDLVRLLGSTTTTYEAGTQTSLATKTYSYDGYGALTYEGREIDRNLIATHTAYTHDATNWLLGRVDEKKVVSHYTLIISHPPPPDYIEGWEKDIYAANGVELRERDRLLCDAAPYCRCPTGQDCTPRNPDGTNARWVPVEQNKTYTAQGNLQYTADAYNHGVTYGYDSDWGTVTSTARTATGDGGLVTLVQQKHYDSFGRLDRETDENNVSTNYHYDPLDRLRVTDLPSGAHTFTDYLNWGDPQQQAQVVTTGPYGDVASANLPLGEMMIQYVDGFGTAYREDTTAGEGKTITRQRIEDFSSGIRKVYYNRPAFVGTNAFPPSTVGNEWLSVSFDASNRPTVIESIAAGQPTRTVETFSYAPLQMTLKDFNSGSVTTGFDSRGRVASKTDAYGTWSYHFDNIGRLSYVDTPNGDQLQLGYDSWGRRNSVIDPVIGATTLVHDDVGNVLSSKDANGAFVSYSFDETGRVRSRTDSKGMIRYSYDRSAADFSLGRLSSVTDHSGSTTLTYDAAGHIAQRLRLTEGRAQPLVADYSYDFLGRLKRKVLDRSTTIDFMYPDGRNLRQVLLNGASFASFSQYDPNRLFGARQTSAATTILSRDSRGLTSDLTTTSTGGAILQQLHADNDVLGDTHSVLDERPSHTEGTTNTDETLYFRYDYDNRLLATIGRFPATYGYDAEGNIAQKGALAITYANRQLTAKSGGTAIVTDHFDSAGSLSSRDDSQGHWVYSYDDDHHLTGVTLNGVARLSAEYDYTGARTKKVFFKSANETVTTYYGDGEEVRQNSNSATTATSIYIAAPQAGLIGILTTGQIAGEPDVPSQLQYSTTPWSGDTSNGPATGLLFFHPNTLGNPALITDASGNVVSHALYEPFGSILASYSVGRDSATTKFAGKESDAETNLVYFGGRYYDPVVGRFTTADSDLPGGAAATQGFNRYSYALNNPIRLMDPDGHDPFGALVGMVAGFGVGLVYSVGQQTWNWANGGDFSVRSVVATTAGFTVTGGLIGLTDGLDIPHATAAGWWASASIAGGITSRTVLGQETTPNDVALDAAAGTGMFKVATVVAPAAARWLNDSIDSMVRPVPMLDPAPAQAPTGGRAPVMKGQAGVDTSIANFEAGGGTVLGREITFDAGSTRVRLDYVGITADGEFVGVDPKNGPNARLQPNQKVGYPILETEGGTPVGNNAAAAGLPVGEAMPPFRVIIDYVNTEPTNFVEMEP